jgi:hypothetical protein
MTNRTKIYSHIYCYDAQRYNYVYLSAGHQFPLSRRQTVFLTALANLSFCKKKFGLPHHVHALQHFLFAQ